MFAPVGLPQMDESQQGELIAAMKGILGQEKEVLDAISKEKDKLNFARSLFVMSDDDVLVSL